MTKKLAGVERGVITGGLIKDFDKEGGEAPKLTKEDAFAKVTEHLATAKDQAASTPVLPFDDAQSDMLLTNVLQ